MTIKTVRNTAVLISSITCGESSALRVGGEIGKSGAEVVKARDMYMKSTAAGSTGIGFLSSGQYIDFPYGNDDKVAFIVSWGCTQTTLGGAVLRVHQGAAKGSTTYTGAWRRDLGNYDLVLDSTASCGGTTAGTLKRWVLGPLESARFSMAAATSGAGATVGDPVVRMQLSSAAGGQAITDIQEYKVRIVPFKLPVVEYAT